MCLNQLYHLVATNLDSDLREFASIGGTSLIRGSSLVLSTPTPITPDLPEFASVDRESLPQHGDCLGEFQSSSPQRQPTLPQLRGCIHDSAGPSTASA
ncbi:hypothetical protein BKA70DRAFT_1423498 [Coprinopsis sp. MPI-PUGE-AT-0042]|nr:hypothetical protein BKA70DRAFT_1423498 [Coprinopsis sp. MPI-PUGE-AT-0042]